MPEDDATAPTRRDQGADASRRNNLGLLRLLLAALVVLSHAPELADGDRARELLTRLCGTLSFGELAVDGFFLVSGYLVMGSYRSRASFADFVAKRALRIYPGFLVASLVSLLVVAPLAGGTLTASALWRAPGRLLLLLMPEVPGAFADLPYPLLNGAMWTIPCEFGCYLLLGALAPFRAVRRRGRYGIVLVLLAALYAVRWWALPHGQPGTLAGTLSEMIRFAFVFACGGAFNLYRDRIALTRRGALRALALLAPLMFSRPLAEPAFAVLGGYLIFWLGLAVRPTAISAAANRTDVSFGLYLYAWPLQSLLLLHAPQMPLWHGAGITLALAALFGYASWRVVERPALRCGKRLLGRRAGMPGAIMGVERVHAG